MATKTDDSRKTFIRPGKAIKLLRVAADLSQKDAAEQWGVSRSYLSQVENGHRDPGLSFLRAVAKGLDVPLWLLLGAEGTEPARPVFEDLRDVFFDVVKVQIAAAEREE